MSGGKANGGMLLATLLGIVLMVGTERAELMTLVPVAAGTEVDATVAKTVAMEQAAKKVKRSMMQRGRFMKQNACPATAAVGQANSTSTSQRAVCSGYVVDHVRPLCSGGEDAPSNMQWQEEGVAKKKDAEEFRLCTLIRQGVINANVPNLCPQLPLAQFPILNANLACPIPPTTTTKPPSTTTTTTTTTKTK